MPSSKKKKSLADVGTVLRKINDDAALRSWVEFMVTIDPWKALGYSADTLLSRWREPGRSLQYFSAADPRNAKTPGFDHEHGLIAFQADGALEVIGRLSNGTVVPSQGQGGYVAALATKTRHKGVGKYLLHAAERVISERHKRVYLFVSETNTAAQRFYKSAGYEQVARVADCICPGNTEILLTKALDS